VPDAWVRFERAVDVVAKSPPQHRTKPKKSKRESPRKLHQACFSPAASSQSPHSRSIVACASALVSARSWIVKPGGPRVSVDIIALRSEQTTIEPLSTSSCVPLVPRSRQVRGNVTVPEIVLSAQTFGERVFDSNVLSCRLVAASL
jgi:hypothetical protein